MLRPFNPEDLDRNRAEYERISDIIVRPLSSSAEKTPSPTEQYNKSFLSDLSKLSDELIGDIGKDIDGGVVDQDELDGEDEETTFTKEFDTKNQKDSNLLAMIFKIIPIGINMAKRGKTIATGFKEVSTGLLDLVKNAAILTAITGVDTIIFFMELFIYLFKLLICSVTMISSFPKCVPFYLLEILVIISIALIVSPLFIVDVIFMVKYFIGISCVEAFVALLTILEQIDKFVYSLFSVHIIHYPDSVIKRCYTCDAMGDTTSFKESARKLFGDIFIDIPKDIGTPIGKTITGIGHIFSFLKL